MSIINAKPEKGPVSRIGLKDILRAGFPGTPVPIEDSPALRAYLRSLLPVLNRFPRLAMLYQADPHRLQRSLGVELKGKAKVHFDQARSQGNGLDSPEEYDKLLDTPASFFRSIHLQLSEPPSLADISPEVANLDPTTPLGEKIAYLDKLAGSMRERSSEDPVSRNTYPPAVTLPIPNSRSHQAATNYHGVTDGWDVVAQLHGSIFGLIYSLFFTREAFESAKDGLLETIHLDHFYNFDGWFLKLFRFELAFSLTDPLRQFVVAHSKNDVAGVKMKVKVKVSSKWTADKEWELMDEFSAVFTRLGKITKQERARLSDIWLSQVFAADLLNGWNEIQLVSDGQGDDDAREQVLEIALNNYFQNELPFLLLSGQFQPQEPFVLWQRAACFTRYNDSDRNTITMCFGDKANSSGSSSDPFRQYILHHDRNIAIGIASRAIVTSVLEGLDAIDLESLNVENFKVTLHHGYILVTVDVTERILGQDVKLFKYSTQITLKIDGAGNLTGNIDEDSLRFPAWLWFLSGIFLKLPGIVLTAVLKALAKDKIGQLVGDRLDLNLAFNGLFAGAFGSIAINNDFNSVEINPEGVFIRGNLAVEFAP